MAEEENRIVESNAFRLPLFELNWKQPDILKDASTNNVTGQNNTESPFSKYIIYVDESGDHSLQSIDEKYPLFVLAFCVFHKRHYSEQIVSALEKFKFNHFGHDQVILHETEIRKEKGAFLKPAQNNRAFEVLKKKFYCDGGRGKAGQSYEGRGLKIYPPVESEKPR
ncbi:DUF3800 domain-containing protein [Oxalobacteraceae bacterium CAVE-383]|nr:DUF3800 domain-containing protein [Oxalobacteraceae bacterium CAVE-383]